MENTTNNINDIGNNKSDSISTINEHHYVTEDECIYIDPTPKSQQLNPHYIQTLNDDTIHSVEIQYSSNNPHSLYTYLTRLKLKKGDTVIIETPSGYYRTVKVIKFHKTPDIPCYQDIDYKWIVTKVPTKKFKQFKKKNKKTIKTIKHQQLLAQREKDKEALSQVDQNSIT